MTKNRPIVFLHLPKTAGQSIRVFLGNAFPKRLMFPGQTDYHLALHSRSSLQKFDIFCGHFSWSLLDCLGPDALVFTVLRDPAQRLVSLYRYLRAQGLALTNDQIDAPEYVGLKLARDLSLDEYLMADNPATRSFLLDNLDNFYMYYFATRNINGRHLVRDVYPASDAYTSEMILQNAIENIKAGLVVYGMDNLDKLERDMSAEDGFQEAHLPNANTGAPVQSSSSISDLCVNTGNALTQIHLLCQHDVRIYRMFCL